MGKLIVLALMLLSGPAMAGTVYRCVGADGVPNYTSKRAANAVCKAVAHSSPSEQSRLSSFSTRPAVVAAPARTVPAVPAVAAAGASTTPGRKVVFQTSPGDSAAPVAVQTSGGNTRVLRGAVYRYEKDGVTHYTNMPTRGVHAKMLFSYVETCYACGVMAGVDFGKISLNTSAFSAEIHSAALQYGVEEAVVRAIIHAESAYRPNAISRAGAQGLMQLIPSTASRFGVVDPFDPAQNIRGGVQYLAWLMKRYSSNLTLVAAAYNAGEGAVDKNGGVPPYSETQRYVQRVGQLADRYRTALAGP